MSTVIYARNLKFKLKLTALFYWSIAFIGLCKLKEEKKYKRSEKKCVANGQSNAPKYERRVHLFYQQFRRHVRFVRTSYSLKFIAHALFFICADVNEIIL